MSDTFSRPVHCVDNAIHVLLMHGLDTFDILNFRTADRLFALLYVSALEEEYE